MDSRGSPLQICGVRVEVGETRELYLKISESYLSKAIQIPIFVIRGKEPGPTAYVMAAIHGDEINGVDIVRRLIFKVSPEKLRGTLIAIPVVNIPGFLAQSRYLPYHRDLNRFFPGKPNGNNAERFAFKLFREIVSKCDFGIDLHTASHGRMNLPHLRGDMSNPRVRNLARAFGAAVLVDQPGVKGSLRREATDAGVPTIIFEAGETARFSRKVSQVGLAGVLGVLSEMGMLVPREKLERPPYQVIVKSSDWIRTESGGILDLKVKPGDLVYEGDILGSILNPFGRMVNRIRASATGIVIGISTAPLIIPGSGIIHLAKIKKALKLVERKLGTTKRKNRRT